MRKILLVDCGSRFVIDLKNVVSNFSDFDEIKILDLKKVDLEKYNGVVVSGAPILLTEVDPKPFLEKIEILLDSQLPYLGICFGHQLLGMYYGAKISIGEKRYKLEKINFNCEAEIHSEINNFHFEERHKEEITLPEGFNLIASSDKTEVEGIMHKEKPLFGLQFHPEISGEHGKQIIKNFINITRK